MTPAGRLFRTYFQEEAERFSKVCRQVEQLNGSSSGIRIGYLFGIEIGTAMYNATRNYRQQLDLPPLLWTRGNPLDLIRAVRANELDVALVFTDESVQTDPDLMVTPVTDVRMVIAAALDNPVVEAAQTAKDLESETFYTWKKNTLEDENERLKLIQHGYRLGLEISHVELLDSPESVHTMMEMGNGVALCTELDKICSSPRIRVFPLCRTNALGLVYRRDADHLVRRLVSALAKMDLKAMN